MQAAIAALMTAIKPEFADLQAKMSEQQALTEIVKEKVMQRFDTPENAAEMTQLCVLLPMISQQLYDVLT